MRRYPKAQGLFTSWLLAQRQRPDLVGELARAVAGTQPIPWQQFRHNAWLKWTAAHGLTEAHVEAAFKEYCHVPLSEKYSAYDQMKAARSVSSVSSNSDNLGAKELLKLDSNYS